MSGKERIFSACEWTNSTSIRTVKSAREINLTKNCSQSSSHAKCLSTNSDVEMKPSSISVQRPNDAYSADTTSQSLLCVAESSYQVPDISAANDLPISLRNKLDEESTTHLRPRVFCLEHAIQVEDLLRSKGGANVLVICHSGKDMLLAHADHFQKSPELCDCKECIYKVEIHSYISFHLAQLLDSQKPDPYEHKHNAVGS